MAKTPAKKTAAKSQQGGGREMQSWDEALAARAAASKAMAASTGGGGKSIKTAGGTFSMDGQDLGDTLEVVILDSVLEDAYYGPDGDYDPDHPKSPICFAIGERGQKQKDLVPHPDSPEPQAESCAVCPWNKFGSAERGKGKANKNIVRMAVLAVDDLGDIDAAEPRIIKVPVTSVKHWSGYTQGISDVKHSDPIKVLTELKLSKHPKFQFEMKFKQVGEVDDELIGALLEKSDSFLSELRAPYRPFEEDADAKPAGRGAGKALAKGKAGGQREPQGRARRAGR